MLMRLLQTTAVVLVAAGMTGVSAAVLMSHANGVVLLSNLQQADAAPLPEAAPLPAPPVEVQAPDDQFDRRFRNFRIRLNRAGKFTGRINVASAATGQIGGVSSMRVILAQSGRIVTETTVNSSGNFEVSGVRPGIYTLIGSGSEGYVTYGVQILDAGTPVVLDAGSPIQEVLFQEVEDSLQIDTLAVPPRDFGAVGRLIQSNVPEELLTNSTSNSQPSENYANAADAGEDERQSTAMRNHEVKIRAGSLYGRMSRIHPREGNRLRLRRMNVFLVQNNTVVGQSPVNESGNFVFKDVKPGLHSFVAAGAEGIAAFAVNAVNSDLAAADAADELTIPVLYQAPGGGDLGSYLQAMLGLPQDIAQQWAQMLNAQGVNNVAQGPAGPGGAGGPLGGPGGGPGGGGAGGGGPAGGGGGGVGGAGGLGALLAGAAGAAIGFAAGDDDNNIISPPGP